MENRICYFQVNKTLQRIRMLLKKHDTKLNLIVFQQINLVNLIHITFNGYKNIL
jgi:hypothetical protein